MSFQMDDMELDSDGESSTDEFNLSGSFSDDDLMMEVNPAEHVCEPRFSMGPFQGDGDFTNCGHQASPSTGIPTPCMNAFPSPFAGPSFSPSSYPASPLGPARKRKKARSLPPAAPDTPSLIGVPNIPTPDISSFSTSSSRLRQRLVRRPSNLEQIAPPTPKKTSGHSRLPLAPHRPQVPIHTPENFSHATPNLTTQQIEEYFDQAFAEKEQIGEGSYSKVYKALRLSDRQWFAIKVSKKPFRGPRSKAKAVKELQIVKHFKHPHVLQYVYAWEHDEKMYIQTELCVQSLSGYMSEEIKQYQEKYGEDSTPYFDEDRLWQFFTDILLGLHHIHRAGFLHLDIKPGNILFDRAGRLKIADFGLALSIEDAQSETELEDGDSRYLAPELLDSEQDNSAISTAVDIFSLGATMFELATLLEMPKEGDHWTQLRRGNLQELMGLKHYSLGLKTAIEAMMNPNPDLRPSVDELLANKRIARIVSDRKENRQDPDYAQALQEAGAGDRPLQPPSTPFAQQFLVTQSAGPRLGTREVRNNIQAKSRVRLEDRFNLLSSPSRPR